MDNSKKFTCLSFCTGYGGIELGLRRVIPTLRTIAYVEIETFAVANLVAKIEEGKLDAAPIWTNLKTFNAQPFRDKVDIIVGGYPCQPFSVAGKRKGEADERHLWPFIRNHIQQIRPLFVFLENVAGHLRLGFDRVVRDLDELGYRVEAGLFTASEVGAPHKRERLFILGYAEEYENIVKRRSGIFAGQETPQKRQANNDQSDRPSELAESSSAGTGRLSGKTDGGSGQQILRQGNGQAGTGGIDSASELADARPDDGRQCESEQQQKELPEELPGGDKLGDPQSQRCREAGPDCQRPATRAASTGTMADTGKQGLQGPTRRKLRIISDQTESSKRSEPCRVYAETRWPARPGQEQYDWEEPRTVESGMGRTVDGFRSRVDELRLLGNGVMEKQAAKAFRILYEKMTGKEAE